MHLEAGRQRPGTGLALAQVTDARPLLGDAGALLVGTAVAIGEVEGAGPDARTDHGRREARALLVGPDRHLKRRAGSQACVVQGLDHFQASEHAIYAVEAATGGLGVQVGAGEHRRQAVIEAGAAGEDIAHPVHADGAAGRLAPTDEEVATGLVEVGQGLAVAAALLGGTDPRHVHEAPPEALRVDAE
ncbi:hypothetical protein D9M68_677290 [compost metagenome]